MSHWSVRFTSLIKLTTCVVASCCVSLVCGGSAALAQTAPQATAAPSAKTEQDALFQRILKEPGNLDIAFRHAEVSVANGDYEAAIGSLERLLFFNPRLQRVKLELGALYFRLGSYEMSREYFTKAIAEPQTPPEVRVRVDAYLAEIDKRLNPNQTTGYVQTGVRYQTNANAGPTGASVRVLGFDATLDQQFSKSPDWNAFTQGTVHNVIDFGNQNGDSLESTLNAYLTKQNMFGHLDTALIDVQTGPRLALLPDTLYGVSVRPYIGGTAISLGLNNYLSAATYGAAIGWTPAPGWNFGLGAERSRRVFHNSADYPTVELQSGQLNTAYLDGAGPLFGGWTWSARGAMSYNDAQVSWQSYHQYGFDVSAAYTLAVPALGTGTRLTFAPFAGYLVTNYTDADAFVDPTLERRDRERKLGLSLDLLVTERFGFGAKVQYTTIQSNISNYETNNLSVFGGPTLRF